MNEYDPSLQKMDEGILPIVREYKLNKKNEKRK